jgi:hypothetical protein
MTPSIAYSDIMINFDDVGVGLKDITNRYVGLGVTLNSIENTYIVSTHPTVAQFGPYPAPATLPTILGGVTGGYGFPYAPSPPYVAVAAGTNTLNPGFRGILISFAFDVTKVSLVGNDMGFGYLSRDDEAVTLTAYDALGNRIGQVYSTINLPSDEGYDLTPATISLPEIRYVAFNYTGTSAGFYAIDDLEFDTVVPAPGAFILGTLGLSVAGWKLRRRKAM